MWNAFNVEVWVRNFHIFIECSSVLNRNVEFFPGRRVMRRWPRFKPGRGDSHGDVLSTCIRQLTRSRYRKRIRIIGVNEQGYELDTVQRNASLHDQLHRTAASRNSPYMNYDISQPPRPTFYIMKRLLASRVIELSSEYLEQSIVQGREQLK